MTEESFIQVILQGQPKNDAQVRTLLLTLPKGTKYIRASCNGRADEFSIYQMARYTLEDVHEQMTQFMEGYLSWTMDMENRVSDNEYKMGAHYMLVGRRTAGRQTCFQLKPISVEFIIPNRLENVII